MAKEASRQSSKAMGNQASKTPGPRQETAPTKVKGKKKPAQLHQQTLKKTGSSLRMQMLESLQVFHALGKKMDKMAVPHQAPPPTACDEELLDRLAQELERKVLEDCPPPLSPLKEAEELQGPQTTKDRVVQTDKEIHKQGKPWAQKEPSGPVKETKAKVPELMPTAASEDKAMPRSPNFLTSGDKATSVLDPEVRKHSASCRVGPAISQRPKATTCMSSKTKGKGQEAMEGTAGTRLEKVEARQKPEAQKTPIMSRKNSKRKSSELSQETLKKTGSSLSMQMLESVQVFHTMDKKMDKMAVHHQAPQPTAWDEELLDRLAQDLERKVLEDCPSPLSPLEEAEELQGPQTTKDRVVQTDKEIHKQGKPWAQKEPSGPVKETKAKVPELMPTAASEDKAMPRSPNFLTSGDKATSVHDPEVRKHSASCRVGPAISQRPKATTCMSSKTKGKGQEAVEGTAGTKHKKVEAREKKLEAQKTPITSRKNCKRKSTELSQEAMKRPRSSLRMQMLESLQVFHALGKKMDKMAVPHQIPQPTACDEELLDHLAQDLERKVLEDCPPPLSPLEEAEELQGPQTTKDRVVQTDKEIHKQGKPWAQKEPSGPVKETKAKVPELMPTAASEDKAMPRSPNFLTSGDKATPVLDPEVRKHSASCRVGPAISQRPKATTCMSSKTKGKGQEAMEGTAGTRLEKVEAREKPEAQKTPIMSRKNSKRKSTELSQETLKKTGSSLSMQMLESVQVFQTMDKKMDKMAVHHQAPQPTAWDEEFLNHLAKDLEREVLEGFPSLLSPLEEAEELQGPQTTKNRVVQTDKEIHKQGKPWAQKEPSGPVKETKAKVPELMPTAASEDKAMPRSPNFLTSGDKATPVLDPEVRKHSASCRVGPAISQRPKATTCMSSKTKGKGQEAVEGTAGTKHKKVEAREKKLEAQKTPITSRKNCKRKSTELSQEAMKRPRSSLRMQMLESLQVFHALGKKMDKMAVPHQIPQPTACDEELLDHLAQDLERKVLEDCPPPLSPLKEAEELQGPQTTKDRVVQTDKEIHKQGKPWAQKEPSGPVKETKAKVPELMPTAASEDKAMPRSPNFLTSGDKATPVLDPEVRKHSASCRVGPAISQRPKATTCMSSNTKGKEQEAMEGTGGTRLEKVESREKPGAQDTEFQMTPIMSTKNCKRKSAELRQEAMKEPQSSLRIQMLESDKVSHALGKKMDEMAIPHQTPQPTAGVTEWLDRLIQDLEKSVQEDCIPPLLPPQKGADQPEGLKTSSLDKPAQPCPDNSGKPVAAVPPWSAPPPPPPPPPTRLLKSAPWPSPKQQLQSHLVPPTSLESATISSDKQAPVLRTRPQAQLQPQDFCFQRIPWGKPNVPEPVMSKPITKEQRPQLEAMKRQAQLERVKASKQHTSPGKQPFFIQREKDLEIARYYGYIC